MVRYIQKQVGYKGKKWITLPGSPGLWSNNDIDIVIGDGLENSKGYAKGMKVVLANVLKPEVQIPDNFDLVL